MAVRRRGKGPGGGQFVSGERPKEREAEAPLDAPAALDFTKGFHVTVSQRHPDGKTVAADGMVAIDEDGTMRLLGVQSPQFTADAADEQQ